MNILVLGGTGLISTPLVQQLVERGDHVTVFNRGERKTALPDTVRRITGDRHDHAAFVTQMRAEGTFDVVIDMIGFTATDAYSLSEAFAGRVGQLVFCSTVDVYAKPAAHYPYKENEAQHALGRYAQGKIEAEAALIEAHTREDFPITIIRPAHTYSDAGTLVHSLGGSTTYLDRLRKGKPIIVHGDGSSLWSSCHAEDVARAFVKAVGNEATHGHGYHVTGEEWLPWNVYHAIVAEALNAPSLQLVHIPTELLAKLAPERAGICAINFQFNNIFDNAAARAVLDFEQTISFAEGARRVVAHLDRVGGIADSDQDPLEDKLIAAWQELSKGMLQAIQ
jgi:nucleoside-diphosphate-sugar epimerase